MEIRLRIRDADVTDLPAIVAIYNEAIPGRLATADTEPATVDERMAWYREFDPQRRPLWVAHDEAGRVIAWLSLRSFYGRPAYAATVEVGVYVAGDAQRRGLGTGLLQHAIHAADRLSVRTILAFVFAHNDVSLRLFQRARFARWGLLPHVAELDGVERDLAILGLRVGKARR